MNKKIIIIIVVSCISSLSGLWYWHYYYNTPVAFEYLGSVYKIDNVSSITQNGSVWYINFLDGESKSLGSHSHYDLKVLSRKNKRLYMDAKEGLTSSL